MTHFASPGVPLDAPGVMFLMYGIPFNADINFATGGEKLSVCSMTVGYSRGIRAASTAERPGGGVSGISEFPLLYAGLRRMVHLRG